jgi:hypothetical protein
MQGFFVDARGAIGTVAFLVGGADQLKQLGVGDGTARRYAVAALVVGGLGDLEQSTDFLDAVAYYDHTYSYKTTRSRDVPTAN